MPALYLPKDQVVPVGGIHPIQYLTLALHYRKAKNLKNDTTSESGVIVSMIKGTSGIGKAKMTGIISIAGGGRVLPHSVEHWESACPVTQPVSLRPIAFSAHTHDLGTAVSGWKVDPNGTWTLIAKADPRSSEMFAPVPDTGLTINQGDIVAARCTMNNTLDQEVRAGSVILQYYCSMLELVSQTIS